MKVAIVLALVAVASAQVAFPGGVIPGGVRVLYPGNFGGYYPFANNQFLVASPFDYGTRIPPVRRVVKVVRPQTVPFVAAPVPVAAAPIAVAPKVEEPVDPNPQYDYSYSVNAPEYGDFKTASESRANGVVTGSYSLVEPDGHVRTVEYVADPVNGFNAVVKNTRDGTA